MLTDGSYISGEHGIKYILAESLCWTFKTNIALCIDYTSIFKKFKVKIKNKIKKYVTIWKSITSHNWIIRLIKKERIEKNIWSLKKLTYKRTRIGIKAGKNQYDSWLVCLKIFS